MGKIQFQNVNKVYPNGFHAIHAKVKSKSRKN